MPVARYRGLPYNEVASGLEAGPAC